MIMTGRNYAFLTEKRTIVVKNICENSFLCKQLLHLIRLQLSKFQSLETTFSITQLKTIRESD